MKILVAVIAYNEEKNIANTLDDLARNNCGYDIVVIDNGSSDNTHGICEKLGVPYLRHCINTGSPYGTVRSYFDYAGKYNYDIICQFDGDGQHIASELPKIIDPVKNNVADFVIGSRFLQKKGFKSSFLRRIGINLFSFINSSITGRKISDTTSGFKAYGKNVIDYFYKTYKNEIYDINQILLLSFFNGARIMEVPIVMKAREHGASEFNFFRSAAFPVKGLINIMGCLLQGKAR
ncbi:MAG: glycosyltransferase family 2 protein [Oligoflexia bacterium]|nr:glycosyltransferase family 2 protein [Oligoflexia bacterium]